MRSALTEPLLDSPVDAVISDLPSLPEVKEDEWVYIPFEERGKLDPKERFKRHFPKEFRELLAITDEEKIDFAKEFYLLKIKHYQNLETREGRITCHTKDGNLKELIKEKPPVTFYEMIALGLLDSAYQYRDQALLDYFYSLRVNARGVVMDVFYPDFLLVAAILTHQPMRVIRSLVEVEKVPVRFTAAWIFWPLKAAAHVGDVSICQYLWRRQERKDRNKALNAGFYEAIVCNQPAAVDYFITQGADIQLADRLHPPLYNAVYCNATGSVERLVAAGAEVTSRVLSVLVYQNSIESLQVLLDKKANIPFDEIYSDYYENYIKQTNVLGHALIAKRFKIASLLLWPTTKSKLESLVGGSRLEEQTPLSAGSFFAKPYDATTPAQIAAARAIIQLVEATPNYLEINFIDQCHDLIRQHPILSFGDSVGVIFQAFLKSYTEIQKGRADRSAEQRISELSPTPSISRAYLYR